MGKIFFIGALIIFFEFNCPGQDLYSSQNLQQASQEDLYHYHLKATKLKKAGVILSIAGSAAFITGSVFILNTRVRYDDPEFIIATYLASIGFLFTIVGIPILITGLSRVSKINKILNKPNGVSIELAPCSFKNLVTRNTQMGITIKLKL